MKNGLHLSRPVVLAALAALALLVWESSGLDLALAAWSGSASGFALRDDWWLNTVMHTGAHRMAWVLVTLLCLGVWWPFGVLRRIGLSDRLRLAVSTLTAAAVVTLIKYRNGASCPWDLTPFGGLVPPVSHWGAFLRPDGGGGHCFPAGHAASGFAFVSGWFVFRSTAPRVALAWLAAAVLAGFALGISQQLRGAHFMSHTLWTLWACVCTAALVERLWMRPAVRGAMA